MQRCCTTAIAQMKCARLHVAFEQGAHKCRNSLLHRKMQGLNATEILVFGDNAQTMSDILY